MLKILVIINKFIVKGKGYYLTSIKLFYLLLQVNDSLRGECECTIVELFVFEKEKFIFVFIDLISIIIVVF